MTKNSICIENHVAMKKTTVLLLPLLLLLTSCATVFNRTEYDINLSASKPNMKVVVNHATYKLPASVTVPRSREDLPIKVISDSVTKKAVIKAALSPEFVYYNLLGMGFAPVYYGVDMFSEKRFYYGKALVLDDTTSVYNPSAFDRFKGYSKKTFYAEKGRWNFVLGIPYGNIFRMQPRNLGVKNGGGFFGIMAGAEYYYNPRKFLKLTASNAIDFLAPVPAPVSSDGDYESMRSWSFALTNNYTARRFILGYGLNYSIYTWMLVSPDYGKDVLAPPPSKRNNHALGLSFSAHHQFSETFLMGATYNTTFYSVFPENKFLYQHTISIELLFRIPLNRPKVAEEE